MTRFLRATAALAVSSALAFLLWATVQLPASAQDAPAALPGQTALRINELMASNDTTLVDPDEPDETPDWIEIYNPTAAVVSLRGVAVTDDRARPTRQVITASVTISPFGYLLLYADNDPRQGPTHLDFGLSADGEYFGLFVIENGNPVMIDEVDFPALPTDVSYERSVDGGGVWRLARPTPGKSNLVDPPWVSGVTTVTVNVDTPAPLGPFAVSATITDDVGVAAAHVVFMTATAPYTAAPAIWLHTPMTATGSDRYQGEIPAQPAGTLVRYYVEASDGAGDESRFPITGRDYGYVAGYQPPRLLINKIVSKNDSIPDPDEPAEQPDWIEIYNPGQQQVSLNGLSITNDRTEPTKFRVPNGIVLQPGGLVTFLADDDRGQNLLPTRKAWHMNFTLNNPDDFLGVYGGEGTALVDAYNWDAPPMWGAFGRVPLGGAWVDNVCVLRMDAANVLCDKVQYMPAIRR